MNVILYVCIIGLFFCGIMHIRNNLIYKYRIRALKETSKKSRAAIKIGKDWKYYFNKFDSYDSYNTMLFDISKWKYESFFPGI